MPTKKRVTVRHLTMGTERYEGAIRSMVPSFEKKNPGVKVEVDGGRDYIELMKMTYDELVKGSARYSVINVATELMPSYGEPLQLLPLDEMIDDPKIGMKDKTDYAPIQWEANSYTRKNGEKHIFGVATDANCTVMYYRKDVLNAHGFKKPPATIDECLEVIRACHDPPRIAGYISQLKEWYSMNGWIPYLWDLGGDLFDTRTWEVTCNSEVGLRSLELLVMLHTKYGVRGEENWGRPDFNENLGNLGTGVLSPSMYANGMPMNPNLSRYADVVKTARVPSGPAGRYSIMAGLGAAIPAACKRPREAFLWIEHQQNKKTLARYCKTGGQPGRESFLNDPVMQRLPNCRHYATLAESFRKDARLKWRIPEEFQVEEQAQFETYAAICDEKTPKQSLAAMEKRLSKLMRDSSYYS